MKNPFHILNLPPDADDAMVAAAYERLSAIHQDGSSQRAREIESAYATIKDQRDRIRFKLLETPQADIPTLMGPMLLETAAADPDKRALLNVLTNNLKGFRLPMPETKN